MKIKVYKGDYGHLFAFKGDRSSRWGDWCHLFSPLHRQAIRVCYVTHSQCLLGVPGSRVMFVLSRCNCTNAFLFPCAQTLLQYDRPNHRQTQGPQTIHYKPVHWYLYYIDFFLQKNNFSINLMVAIAVCTRWVFRHVCFVFNGHANGTSDHHRVDHRGKRTFFNQCLVTVHPTRNISRGWHHADSAVGLLEKK